MTAFAAFGEFARVGDSASAAMGPGWTLLTVMPRGPSSRANPRVRPATAAFVIA